MRTLILLGCVLWASGYAAAQTSPGPAVPAGPAADAGADAAGAGTATVEAIAAIVRGDYARAAELLQPQVANWARDMDPAAAFFLAALYENGLGVPQDEIRACALHVRTTGSSGPFASLGHSLARARMEALGPDWARDCMMLANIGFSPGFTPASFTLDSEHWVGVELSAAKKDIVATVSFRGKQAEAVLGSPTLGAIFLPTVYTALQSRVESASPRHFLEMAMWTPGSESQWSLVWSLSEVVGADVIAVETRTLTTMHSDVPPRDVSVDLRDLVSLHATDSGGVEFVILSAPDATAEAIPTIAERREIAQEAAKRKTADEKVNWKRRRDPSRPPSFSYDDADGCSDLFVYGWSAGRAEAIAIRADRQLLELTTAPRTFDLAASQAEIEVVADVYERPQRRLRFCYDVSDGSVRQETWRAIAGTMTIQLSPPGMRAQDPQRYKATVQIDNAEFVNAAGQSVRPQQPIRLTAVAGPKGNGGP